MLGRLLITLLALLTGLLAQGVAAPSRAAQVCGAQIGAPAVAVSAQQERLAAPSASGLHRAPHGPARARGCAMPDPQVTVSALVAPGIDRARE